MARLYLQIAVWWGETLLAVYRTKNQFVIGDPLLGPTIDFPLDPAAIGHDQWALVQQGAKGPEVAVPGKAAPIPLVPGQVVRAHLGALDFCVELDTSVSVPQAPRSNLNQGLFAAIAASAVGHAALGLSLFTAVPALGPTDSTSEVQFDRLLVQAAFAQPLALAAPEPAQEPAQTAGPSQGEVNRCNDEPSKAVGIPIAQSTGRWGIAGPKDNPDPHVARIRGQYVKAHPVQLGALGPILDSAPTFPWGRDDALGTDAIFAAGKMWGDTLESTKGSDGQGQSGHCEAGGCGAGGLVAQSTVPSTVSRKCTPRRERVGLHDILTRVSDQPCEE